MKRSILFAITAALTATLCAGCAGVPDQSSLLPDRALLEPDYEGIEIPVNIAPLNFTVLTEGDRVVVTAEGDNGQRLLCRSRECRWNERKWHRLLEENRGGRIVFKIYVKRGSEWFESYAEPIEVSSDAIDNYVSYRLIEPSYEFYGYLALRERSLTNFDERDIYNNAMEHSKKGSQCINCHTYCNYHTDRFQFHVRHTNGGTMIVRDGKAEKINLKVDGVLSNGVYSSWHPSGKLIAYSVNQTGQLFHSLGNNKVEVQDIASDLVLYNTDDHTVQTIVADPLALETFPCWAPDGRSLYYASCPIDSIGTTDRDIAEKYDQLRYNICRIDFDPATNLFGQPVTVVDAAARSMSATFPRISPDGRLLLYTIAPYGTFHIWHPTADLEMTEIGSGRQIDTSTLNSDQTESYHSWSSTGRWIVFSSRRDDGSYTRLYIAHIDPDGRQSKPFVLPQRDPKSNQKLLKSYNVPQFTVEKVPTTPRQLFEAVKKERVEVTKVK